MFRFDHAALNVVSLARSAEFYQSLGAKVVSRPSPHFLEMVLGELRLHFVPISAASATNDEIYVNHSAIDHICLRVETVEELEKLCEKFNANRHIADFGPFEIRQSPPMGHGFQEHAEQSPPTKTLYAKDPDGIKLEVRYYRASGLSVSPVA